MKLAALAISIALAGCATTEMVWNKPGGTADEFYADRGECQARTFSIPNASAFQTVAVFAGCMQGRGWRQEERPRR